MGQLKKEVNLPLNGSSKPQFHYFYGSTDSPLTTVEEEEHDQEETSLIGEGLVGTDEEEGPRASHEDLEHLIVTKGDKIVPKPIERRPHHGGSVARIMLVIGLAVAMTYLLFAFFPRTADPETPVTAIHIPFETVNRSDFGDPVDGILDLNLFHPALLSSTGPQTFVFPFPTGAFWTNLVVPSPSGDYSYPVAVYPYAYKWSQSTLLLSYPFYHRYTDAKTIIDTVSPDLTFSIDETVTKRRVTRFDPLSVSLRFRTSDDKSRMESFLVQGSPYATLQYTAATPIVRALSIFKSVQCPGDDAESFGDFFDNEDRRRLFGVCTVDDSDNTQIVMRGVQFILRTNEGVWWMIFASEPIEFVFDAIRKTTIKATAPFTGILRFTTIPVSGDLSFSSSGLRRLIYHAGVYPVGADITWSFGRQSSASVEPASNSTSSAASVRFNFQTKTWADSSLRPNAATEGLLMFALPHHADVLPSEQMLNHKHFDLTYNCIKGEMTPVVGSSWTYSEPLLDLKFDGPTQGWDPSVRTTILAQVDQDIDRFLPTRAENVYGYGKQSARLAQLAHIAKKLSLDESKKSGNNTKANATNVLLDRATTKLWNALDLFLSSEVSDRLLFDSNIGGLVSINGLSDRGEDFGNGRYNDHLFHYGYILYACAVMGDLNSTFVEEYGTHVDSIFFDVAYYTNKDSKSTPSSGDAFFPFSRHKSWFDGHSFATGLFPFGNGKSQESSSEAVNCYYGAYLWSLVRRRSVIGLSEITDFARLLLAMEIRSVKKYWHMIPTKEAAQTQPANATGSSLSNSSSTPAPAPVDNTPMVYPNEFAKNYMVGNVGMLDVACNTWFGNAALYVHMINAIPITAATAVLFDKHYVSQEYPYLMQGVGASSVEMAWRGYTIAIEAILDANKAWNDAQSLVSYELDTAISSSQTLYWISNRPEFNVTFRSSQTTKNQATAVPQDSSSSSTVLPASPVVATSAEGANPSDEDSDSSASCGNYPQCIALGLTGLCCPTSTAVQLDCCS